LVVAHYSKRYGGETFDSRHDCIIKESAECFEWFLEEGPK